MSKINTYKDLLIWQKGIEIVKEVYFLAEKLPDSEKYGIPPQLQRSAISIPSNIAEGWGRESTKNYSQFIKIARGSLLEIETLITIIEELSLMDSNSLQKIKTLITEESKMINSFLSSLKEFV